MGCPRAPPCHPNGSTGSPTPAGRDLPGPCCCSQGCARVNSHPWAPGWCHPWVPTAPQSTASPCVTRLGAAGTPHGNAGPGRFPAPPPRGPSPRGKADTRGPLPLPFRLYKAGSAVPPPRPRGPGPAAFFCLLWAEPGRAGRDGAGGTAPGARCPPAPKGRAAGRAPAEQRPPPCSNPAPVQVRRLRRGPGPAAPRSARWDRRERGGQPRGGTGRDGAGTAPMDRAGWSRGQLGGEAVGREEAAAPGRAGGSSPGRPPTVAVLELVLGRARGGGDERQERPRCVPASPPSARAGGGSPSPGRGRDVSARGGEEWS